MQHADPCISLGVRQAGKKTYLLGRFSNTMNDSYSFLRIYLLRCLALLGSLLGLWLPLMGQQGPLIIGDSSLHTSGKVHLAGQVAVGVAPRPVLDARVHIMPLDTVLRTDKRGVFELDLLPGTYTLEASFGSWAPQKKEVRLYASGIMSFLLNEWTTSLEAVTISAEGAAQNIEAVATGIERIRIEEIRMLPSFLGEVDVIKSLELLPGVSSVGEGASGFNVRGGRVDQNLILQDGAFLFNPSHVLGFFSAFNPDVVSQFSLYKGHIPAAYGGRIASVLEVKLREGDYERHRFQGGLGLVSGRMVAEGPLVKGQTSYLLGGRATYSDWLLRRVNDLDVQNSQTAFYDANVRLSHRFNDNHKLLLSWYSSGDRFRFSDEFGFRWATQNASAEWNGILNEKLLTSLTASWGNYKSVLFDPAGFDARELTNGMRFVRLHPRLSWTPGERHHFQLGMTAVGLQGRQESVVPLGEGSAVVPEVVPKDRGREWAVYIQDEWTLNERIALSLGLRYSVFQQTGPYLLRQYAAQAPRRLDNALDSTTYAAGQVVQAYGGLEPRLSARIKLGAANSLKLSYNRGRQYIHLISNSTTPTPVDIWQVSNAFLPPQIGDQWSLGYYHNFSQNAWEGSLELYYKQLQNLVEYKDFARLLLNPHLETELLQGRGRAYGAEFSIKRNAGRWTGWLAYTYSRTWIQVQGLHPEETINRGAWYPASIDQPHNLSLLATYAFRGGGSMSFNFSYKSGRPISAIVASYLGGGVAIPQYSQRNAYRIPDYFRIDMAVQVPSVVKKWNDNLNFSVYNLLFRKNAYSVFYFKPLWSFVPKPHKLSVLGVAFPALTYNIAF